MWSAQCEETLDDPRRAPAVCRRPHILRATTLKRALDRIGFVQADPIRAPARALAGLHAGNGLSSCWSSCENAARCTRAMWTTISHGTVKNYRAGSSNATTQLLDAMHYRGTLRVARRERGIRIYTVRQHEPGPADPAARRARLDSLVDAAVRIYAPLPGVSLAYLVRRLRFAAPQWHVDLKDALARAKPRLSHSRVDGVDWYWPAGEEPAHAAPQDVVRLLAPFDPVVRDRWRFERLWGWVYRFEAYTPAPKRKRGYYALPLLWRDRVIGWGNLAANNGQLESDFGYIEPHPPRDRVFRRELETELDRMRVFLGLREHTTL
jgi:uncharacterized protein YcaQ